MSNKLIASDKLILFCVSFIPMGLVFAAFGDLYSPATGIGVCCFLFGAASPLCVMTFRNTINKNFDASIKQAAEDEVRKRKLAEAERRDTAAKRKDEEAKKAERIAVQRIARLKEYEKALSFSTYELAELVIDVVEANNYDKLKEIACVLSDQMHIDEVLVEASEKLSSRYCYAIKEISDTRCVDINYSEKEVAAKLESLVDSCITIGVGAIGKKTGLSASFTGSSSNKGEIRKTKSWKDSF